MTTAQTLRFGAVVRIVYGLGAMFAPGPLAASIKMDAFEPDARYTNGLFGGRDLSVAWATLTAVGAGREREAVLLNASCEATDTVNLALELRRRGRFETALVVGLLFNVVGWATALTAAKGLQDG